MTLLKIQESLKETLGSGYGLEKISIINFKQNKILINKIDGKREGCIK